MAISKIKAIKVGSAQKILKSLAKGGGAKAMRARMDDAIAYGTASEKTKQLWPMNGQAYDLVTSYACSPETAAKEFELSKKEYEAITGRSQPLEKNVLMYSIIQSYKPGEVTPEQANELGNELAMRFTKGKHAYIVATHTDKDHVHNHIYFNSTKLDCTGKFRDFWFSALALQKLNDQISIENGLSIIRQKEGFGKPYNKWQEQQEQPNKPLTHREILKSDIEAIVQSRPNSYEDFLKQLAQRGYRVQQGKHVSVTHADWERAVRLKSLGDDYTQESLSERIKNPQVQATDQRNQQPHSRPMSPRTSTGLGLIILLEDNIKAQQSAGYKHWATGFNVQQTAKTLQYLAQNNIDNYDTLVQQAQEVSVKQQHLQDQIKPLDSRLDEITALQNQIRAYGQTKPIFDAYKKSGYSKKFLEQNQGELDIYRAATRHFGEYQNAHGHLPKMQELTQEFAQIRAEKGKLMAQRKQFTADHKDIQNAKRNVEAVLALHKTEQERQTVQQKSRDR